MSTSETRVLATRIFALVLFLGASATHAADANPAAAGETGKPVVEQLVDTLTALAHGPYPGHRSNHAKGVMARGTFTPDAGAAGLSKAPHLQKAASEVIVRFSTATGVPTIPDASPNARPYGMAIRFRLADGTETDIVSIGINRFPVATPEEFLEFLNAVAASGPDAPKPSPIERFLESHPAALKFVTTPKPAPASFATKAFFGVNAFAFTNANGETRYGRYRIMPLAGEQSLTEEQATAAAPDYLMEELPARLSKEKVKFRISVQLAAPGDVVDNATAVWPDDRPQVTLGILTLDGVLPDGKTVEKSLMFSPLNLPDGIAGSDDPVLSARPAAYSVSFGRR